MEAERKLMHDHAYFEALHAGIEHAKDNTFHEEGERVFIILNSTCKFFLQGRYFVC